MTDSTSRTIIVTDQYLSESEPTPVREVAVDPRLLKDSTSPDAVIISSRARPSGTGTVRFGEACVAISFRSVQIMAVRKLLGTTCRQLFSVLHRSPSRRRCRCRASFAGSLEARHDILSPRWQGHEGPNPAGLLGGSSTSQSAPESLPWRSARSIPGYLVRVLISEPHRGGRSLPRYTSSRGLSCRTIEPLCCAGRPPR